MILGEKWGRDSFGIEKTSGVLRGRKTGRRDRVRNEVRGLVSCCIGRQFQLMGRLGFLVFRLNLISNAAVIPRRFSPNLFSTRQRDMVSICCHDIRQKYAYKGYLLNNFLNQSSKII